MSMPPEKHISVMKMPNGTDSHRWSFLNSFIYLLSLYQSIGLRRPMPSIEVTSTVSPLVATAVFGSMR